MNTQEYEDELVKELNKLLVEYENRISKGIQYKHVTADDSAKIIVTAATVGGAVGTAIPIPGAGNAIGAAAGTLLATGIIAAIEAYYARKNKRIDNGVKIYQSLASKSAKYDLIKYAAHKVIQERKATLETLRNPEANKKSVAAYLAANMMSAIKHADGTKKSVVDIMVDGVRDIHSKKVSSHHLVTKNKQSVTLKELAKNQNDIQRNASHNIAGLEYLNVPGDGSCLYHAVGLYVNQDQAYLRRIVAAHLEHNIHDYRAYITLTEGQTLQSYLQGIRNGEEWADNVTIEVLMRVLNRPIVVIGPEGSIRNPDDVQRYQGEPIYVSYNGHNHYDAYLRKDGYSSQDILNNLIKMDGNTLRKR